MRSPINVLLLAEGDAETSDSWSGSSRSVLTELRARGHGVIAGDVELRGFHRLIDATLTFSTNRSRWRTKFRLGAPAFQRRSRNAARLIAVHRANTQLILQVGATFAPLRHAAIPFVLLCDSNIRLAMEGAASGYGEAVALTVDELRDVEAREAAVYRDATAIFTLSEHTRRSFVEGFGLRPENVTPIYGGPNFDLRKVPAEVPPGSTRPPTVLFVGRQFARKGGDVLLQAFRRVRESIADAELVVIGPEHLGVSDPGVHCLGFVNKDGPAGWTRLAEAYRSADVFCLPTRFEPFGIVFIEAMHFGLPCVGTDVWAVPEIIADGETGFVVPPNHADALADRLLRLLGDRALARHMGAAGQSRARRLFTWSAAVDRMLDTLEGLIPTTSGGSGRAPTNLRG